MDSFFHHANSFMVWGFRMNPRVIIIAILILIKVIGVASRVKADNYMSSELWQNCQSNGVIYYGYCEND